MSTDHYKNFGNDIKQYVIDEVPITEWRFWEQFYIDLFRSWNCNLKQQKKGGGGLCHHTKITIEKIKQYTHRRIRVRYHPRSAFPFKQSGVVVERPVLVPGSYDDFDIFYNYHCVINHNSGPAVQAAISGVPVLCDQSSLAADLSIKWSELDSPYVPDRTEWFVKLCHTEWTVEEIRQGIPIARLFS